MTILSRREYEKLMQGVRNIESKWEHRVSYVILGAMGLGIGIVGANFFHDIGKELNVLTWVGMSLCVGSMMGAVLSYIGFASYLTWTKIAGMQKINPMLEEQEKLAREYGFKNLKDAQNYGLKIQMLPLELSVMLVRQVQEEGLTDTPEFRRIQTIRAMMGYWPVALLEMKQQLRQPHEEFCQQELKGLEGLGQEGGSLPLKRQEEASLVHANAALGSEKSSF